MSEWVLRESHGVGVAGLVLRRAERRNALCVGLLDQLCASLEGLAADPANRVVVLRGEGPVFSAGLDLHEAAEDSLIERSAAGVSRALRLLSDGPLVSIAVVQGGAFAGGAGVMAACDIVIAADDAWIGFPEARRGLLPALIGDVLRTRVREGDLRDLLLTGTSIDAQRARQVGLVQHIVPPAKLLEEALRIAHEVLAGGPETIRATKKLLAALYGRPGDHADHSMHEWHLEAQRSEEARAGLQAFLQKRDPPWTVG